MASSHAEAKVASHVAATKPARGEGRAEIDTAQTYAFPALMNGLGGTAPLNESLVLSLN